MYSWVRDPFLWEQNAYTPTQKECVTRLHMSSWLVDLWVRDSFKWERNTLQLSRSQRRSEETWKHLDLQIIKFLYHQFSDWDSRLLSWKRVRKLGDSREILFEILAVVIISAWSPPSVHATWDISLWMTCEFVTHLNGNATHCNYPAHRGFWQSWLFLPDLLRLSIYNMGVDCVHISLDDLWVRDSFKWERNTLQLSHSQRRSAAYISLWSSGWLRLVGSIKL